jgi:hypothetical protein
VGLAELVASAAVLQGAVAERIRQEVALDSDAFLLDSVELGLPEHHEASGVVIFDAEVTFKPRQQHTFERGLNTYDVGVLAMSMDYFSNAESPTDQFEIDGHIWTIGDGDDSLAVSVLRSDRESITFRVWVRYLNEEGRDDD